MATPITSSENQKRECDQHPVQGSQSQDATMAVGDMIGDWLYVAIVDALLKYFGRRAD